MSAHHWIQGHCTKCGVRREKVRVQGPCLIPSKPVSEHYAALDPNNIKHVVVSAQSNPDAFKSDNVAHLGTDQRHVVFTTQSDPDAAKTDVLAKQVRELINDAGKEFGKILYGGKARPYAQNPLFETTPSKRSIEPHKKRREK